MQLDSIEDMSAFMKRAGLPTLNEYVRMSPESRKKLRGLTEIQNLLAQIIDNKQPLARVRGQYRFVFETPMGKRYNCGTRLDHLIRDVESEGYTIDNVKQWSPQVREDETTGYFMEIIFKPDTSPGGIYVGK